MKHRIRLLAVLAATALTATALITAAPAPADSPPPAPFVVTTRDLPTGRGAAGGMDLTSVGDLDWVHPTGTGADRKADPTTPIVVEDLNPDGGRTTLDDSPVSFGWSDGAGGPSGAGASATGITTGGVYNYDTGTVGEATGHDAGYRITVPAADIARRLVVVGGVWQATGQLTVAATDGTGDPYRIAIKAGGTAAVKRYTVTLRPGTGLTVTARYATKLHPAGNLSLSAVALGTLDAELTAADAPVAMDLTAEGIDDWLHLDGPTINRRAGVPPTTPRPTVGNRQSGGTIGTQNDNPVTYSWSDGTPTATQPGTLHGGIFFADGADTGELTGSYGYDLTIPAADQPRTVRFVSGVWRAAATVSVALDGATTPSVLNTDLVSTDPPISKLYELRLGPGQSARITAQLTRKSDPSGNVTLAGVSVASTSADGYRTVLERLVDQVATTDVSAADDAARRQLDREISTARALLADTSAQRDELRIGYLFARAAFDQARWSAANAPYTFRTHPGLTASFGWEGDRNAPIAFIDGSYRLRSRGDLMITFGVPDIPGKIAWSNAEGYLPAFISSYAKDGLTITIESFADLVVIDRHRFEIAYSRMTVTNTTTARATLPRVSTALTPLTDTGAATTIEPGRTVVRDYAVAADRFDGSYDWPTAAQLQDQGGFDRHYRHMRGYWNDRLSAIADITQLPDPRLINAYKAGYIYTLIIRDDIDGVKELHVGENGYDEMFDHDTIGIVATLLTIGDFRYAREYLQTLPAQLQYDDAKWKYSWPYALYLQRTGDKDFIRRQFDVIKKNTHTIETDRIDGGTGIIKATDAIDSHGYWTIDNWAALTGLTTYRYLATSLGETAEAAWAEAEYDDLLKVATARIDQTIEQYDLDYIPISMVEPNETGPRKDPRDANWASMFLFGRWAWDGYLFGAQQTGTMITKIDDTYTHGFERRQGISDTIANFGGYPHGYFSSAYNAGYGSSALRGERYRDIGIRAYQFMIDKSMSGPYGWWEGVDYPDAASPWNIDHAAGGGGSNQHMWGQSTATKVLFDSLIAERSDGTVIIGRGVPDGWLGTGHPIGIDRYPITDDHRLGYRLTTVDRTVTIRFTGDTATPTGYSIELPALRDNIARVSDPRARIDQTAGTIRLPRGTRQVSIVLRTPA